jgi:hypothetical protein
MSKVAISGDSSGTGTFTIKSPNSNTDRTLNLPDNSGTVLTSASNLAGVTGVGKVLQVVQGTTNTTVTVATTTYTDTGLSASITPSSASSKILVLVNQSYLFSSTTAPYTGVQMLRNGTVIFSPLSDSNGPFELGFTGSGGLYNRVSINFLDNPGTTSAITYKTQGRLYETAGSAVVSFQVGGNTINGTSTIILMEIAA